MNNFDIIIKNEAKELLKNLIKTNNEVPYWFETRKQLLINIINNDLYNFLSWPIIRNTMYVVNTDYSKTEYNEVMNSKNYIKWSYALLESGVGSPQPSSFSPSTSDNLTHTIYHLVEFENKTNSNINTNETILEFGGGYGCMANVVKKLNGCKNYVIFDFPEFNLLQKYYLTVNGVTNIHTNFPDFLRHGGILLTSNINDIQAIGHFDLLIATWSLSEAPIEFRKQFLSNIACKNYLIAYQKQFDDANSFLNIDNNTFFDEMSSDKNYNWNNYKINHLFGEQYYLFGNKIN